MPHTREGGWRGDSVIAGQEEREKNVASQVHVKRFTSLEIQVSKAQGNFTLSCVNESIKQVRPLKGGVRGPEATFSLFPIFFFDILIFSIYLNFFFRFLVFLFFFFVLTKKKKTGK